MRQSVVFAAILACLAPGQGLSAERTLPSLEQVLQVTHTTERAALLRTLVETSPGPATRAVAAVRLLEVHLLLRQHSKAVALLEQIDVSQLDRNDQRLVHRLKRAENKKH